MSNPSSAKGPDITGVYSLGASSPEGGSHLLVLEDGKYAITHFGGIQIGDWKHVEGAVFQFTPKRKESEFELFGRHNKDLDGRTKILFGGFENGETFVQVRAAEGEDCLLQRVFNSDANCFSPPYVHTFETVAHSIAFMSTQHDSADRSVITIENPDGYNDFVAGFVEVNDYEGQPFFAAFEDGGLRFDEGDTRMRSPLDQVGEDLEFIRQFIEVESNRETIYMNPSYNPFGSLDDEAPSDINEHHVFDEQKNAYIDKEYYVEGAEHATSDESYDDMSIIYLYAVVKGASKESIPHEISEQPLFNIDRF